MNSRKYGHITLPSFHIDAECLIDQKPDLKIRQDDFELADSASKESFIENKPSMSYWQDAWRRLYLHLLDLFSRIIPTLSKHGDMRTALRSGNSQMRGIWQHMRISANSTIHLAQII
jgi:hypothetical protein